MAEESLIGPHEGKEFALLDSGQKHVAFFHDIVPDEYLVYREKEQYGSIEFYDDVKGAGVAETVVPYVILYRKSHKEQAERLAEIIKNGYENYYTRGESIEREIGNILSYPIAAVEYFIARKRSRGEIA